MSRARTRYKHLPKYVTVIHGAYWFRPPSGENIRLATLGDEVTMYREYAKHLEPVTHARTDTLNDCFNRYVLEVLPGLAPRTQKDYLRHIAVLREVFGHMAPNEVQPRDVGRFLDVQTGKIQKNRQVAVLSAVYSKMVGRWYCAERNPCTHVERNEGRRRTRYVSDAEYATVRAAMPPRVQIAMDLALLTGQRQGDLLALRWAQVSEEGIFFQQGKTGKKLLVGLSPALSEVLERAKRLLPNLPREYVLRTRNGSPYAGEGFRAIWQRRMRRLVASGAVERFTFHDLRAKAVSDSATLEEAFERAGHTSMQMTRGTYDRGTRKVKPLR